MNNAARRGSHYVSSTLMIVGVLFLALLATVILIIRREPPLQTVPPEPVLTVEVARMTPEDVSIVKDASRTEDSRFDAEDFSTTVGVALS